ncbi:hypothetical protein LCGC14_2424330 [marine sediment metagenome]|uniref:Uncharacterized protein n=1 Tax=marine sediment metagenome TaxID=412755 RepID=A0A0F9E0U7_9ZZZZ
MRKINLKLLIIEGAIYRVMLVVTQTLFFWIITKEFKLALGTSLIWNGINLGLYYVYHYLFLSFFKMGKNH